MIALLALAFGAPCVLDVPAETAFVVQRPAGAGGAHLLLDLPLDDVPTELLERLLAGLAERDARAVFTLPMGEQPVRVREAEQVREAGHDLALRATRVDVRANAERGPALLRKTLKPFNKAYGRVRVVELAVEHPMQEAVLNRVGIRAVLETNGPATASPRRQQMLEGQVLVGAILPAGPYAGACGTSPEVQTFTPAAADRVTRALKGAMDAPVGVVRLTVAPKASTELDVLFRWLDEVVLPAGIPVQRATSIRDRAVEAMKDRAGKREPVLGGRLVSEAVLREAARVLKDQTLIPRSLPGELNPTEAFQGFTRLLAGQVDGEMVRLVALKAPRERTPTRGEVVVDRAAVIALSQALLAELPATLPGALPLGGQVVGAPELLQLFAAAVRGEDPCRTVPVQVMDPNAPGLGWEGGQPL